MSALRAVVAARVSQFTDESVSIQRQVKSGEAYAFTRQWPAAASFQNLQPLRTVQDDDTLRARHAAVSIPVTVPVAVLAINPVASAVKGDQSPTTSNRPIRRNPSRPESSVTDL
jgi:hypothetical protein